MLDGEAIAQRADDPADFTLLLVVVVHDDVANRTVQQELEAKRVVDPADERARIILRAMPGQPLAGFYLVRWMKSRTTGAILSRCSCCRPASAPVAQSP